MKSISVGITYPLLKMTVEEWRWGREIKKKKKRLVCKQLAIQDLHSSLIPFLKQLGALKTQYYFTVLCETGVSKLMQLTLLSHFLPLKKSLWGCFTQHSMSYLKSKNFLTFSIWIKKKNEKSGLFKEKLFKHLQAKLFSLSLIKIKGITNKALKGVVPWNLS